MSTTSLSQAGLRTAAVPRSPSFTEVGLRLGWKELRQISPLAIGIAAIQLLLIVLLYSLNAALQRDFPVDPALIVSIAMVSPTLLAIAMVGVSIGQERQNGNWTWSSSLPISWVQSFLGKVLAWLFYSVLTTALLLAVSAVVVRLQGESVGEAMFAGWRSWTHLMAIVIAVQVFLYFSLATLLFRDTLFAMVLAGIFVAVFHCLVVTVAISSVHSVKDPGYLSDEAMVAASYAASFLVGCIALASAYRWRWGVGNYSTLIAYDVPQPPPSAISQSLWAGFANRTRKPSESWMLFSHSVHTSFYLRLVVTLGSLLAIAFASMVNAREPNSFLVALFASCILGVSAFSGDQVSGRFRFFTDRGVRWPAFLFHHIAPPFALATLMAAFAAVATHDRDLLWLLLLFVPIFMNGVFAAIGFSSPIVSVTVALAMVLACAAFTGSAATLWAITVSSNPTIVVYAIIALTISLATAIALAMPRWLQSGKQISTRFFFGTLAILSFLPAAIILCLGFLTIKNPPWEGVALSEIQPIDWTNAPAFVADGRLQTEQPTGFASWSQNRNRLADRVYESVKSQLAEQTTLSEVGGGSGQDVASAASPVEQMADWLTNRSNWLDAVESKSQVVRNGFQWRLSNTIENSAVIAAVALREHKPELAARAFKANRRLVAFAQQPALMPISTEGIVFSWEIWATLTDDELRALSSVHDLRELMPPPIPTRHSMEVILRARATLQREMSQQTMKEYEKSIFEWNDTGYMWALFPQQRTFFPPLQWAVERQQSLSLNRALAQIRDSRPLQYGQVWDQPYDVLPNYYSLLVDQASTAQQRVDEFLEQTKTPLESK